MCTTITRFSRELTHAEVQVWVCVRSCWIIRFISFFSAWSSSSCFLRLWKSIVSQKELYFNAVRCKSAEIKRPEIKILNNIKLRCKCKQNQNYLLKRECVFVLTKKLQQVISPRVTWALLWPHHYDVNWDPLTSVAWTDHSKTCSGARETKYVEMKVGIMNKLTNVDQKLCSSKSIVSYPTLHFKTL